MRPERIPIPDLMPDIVRRFLQIGILFGFQLAVLLVCSGKPGWLWAWVYLGVYIVGVTTSTIILLRRRPETIAERGKVAGMERWDLLVGGSWGLLFFLGIPLVAGLDERFGWTDFRAVPVHIAGTALFAAGLALFSWAMIENAFFATVARIQDERGQTVCTTGPYRVVRHPAYVAAMIQCLTAPMMLGSAWSFAPGCLAASLMVLRTYLEDRMLLRELDGYASYANLVKYRLVPGVW